MVKKVEKIELKPENTVKTKARSIETNQRKTQIFRSFGQNFLGFSPKF